MGQLKENRGQVLMNVNLSANVRLDRKMKLAMLALQHGVTASQMLDKILDTVQAPDNYDMYVTALEAKVQRTERVYSHDKKMEAHGIMNKFLTAYEVELHEAKS